MTEDLFMAYHYAHARFDDLDLDLDNFSPCCSCSFCLLFLTRTMTRSDPVRFPASFHYLWWVCFFLTLCYCPLRVFAYFSVRFFPPCLSFSVYFMIVTFRGRFTVLSAARFNAWVLDDFLSGRSQAHRTAAWESPLTAYWAGDGPLKLFRLSDSWELRRFDRKKTYLPSHKHSPIPSVKHWGPWAELFGVGRITSYSK